MQLRPYQQDLKNEIYRQWQSGARNVMPVLATGGGKTVIAADIFREHQGYSVAIAHRQELVSQISLAFARCGVYHSIMAPKSVIRFISSYHRTELGRSFYNPDAPAMVAGVDTLLRRDVSGFANRVSLAFIDEGHHVLANNKWGKALNLFPSAYGFLMTATPLRADGKGLGRHADGLADALVVGASMRDMMTMGALTDYRIFAPPSDFDVQELKVGADGDYTRQTLKKAAKKSHIVGDVVQHYKRFADGKLGVTFATDVETAGVIASQFNANGVRAEAISAETPDAIRVELIRQFRAGEIKQLVNVDLFGEGFDLPAIEVVSMARPTQSYSVYAQQFGRALRPMQGKECAIIIDHVGNVVRHGLPDAPREWTLDAREKGVRRAADVPGLTPCLECFQPYKSYMVACPHCGARKEPSGRSTPEQVEGDLVEMTPEALAALRGEVERVEAGPDLATIRRLHGPVAAAGQQNRHFERMTAIDALKDAMGWWCAWREQEGLTVREAQKLFYQKFGVDVVTAQTLKRSEAEALRIRIMEKMEKC